MEIRTVPFHLIHQHWPKIEAFIASGLMFSEDYTIDQARALLGQGYWHLVIAEDGGEIKGACSIEFSDRANARVAVITSIGGRMIVSNETRFQLEELMKRCGATRIECSARPSAARLYSMAGMRQKCIVMESEI